MSYTASVKLAIVKYAEAHGNRAAGRQYDGVVQHSAMASAEGAAGKDATC